MPSAELSLPQRAARLYCSATQFIDRLQPLFALAVLIYIAKVFFFSVLTKLHDWNITLALFRNEYHVPVLPPAVAAVLGMFFQAEDGIRDWSVTGVQTCALPI